MIWHGATWSNSVEGGRAVLKWVEQREVGRGRTRSSAVETDRVFLVTFIFEMVDFGPSFTAGGT